jgi:hypothetical protein
MDEVIDLPQIDPTALDRAPAATANVIATARAGDVAIPKPTLKDIALAEFADAERQIVESTKTLTGVVHDLSTTTKLNDAISLRNRLVKKPLAAMRATSKDVKSTLTQVGKDVTAREEELVIEFAAVDALITPQIDAREKEIAEAEQRETDRKARHTAGIARIAGYVAQAAESTAEKLAAGIPVVEAIDVSGFEEFTQEAEQTKARTLASLRALLEKAQAREAAAKLLAAQTLALEIGQRVTALFGKPAAAIRDALNLLELTVFQDDIDASVTKAHAVALAQLNVMLAAALQKEADDAELAKLRAAQVPAPVPPAPAPEPAPAPVEPVVQDPPQVFDRAAAAPSPAAEPVLFVSPGQLAEHDPQRTGKSPYLPAMKQREGNFTQPLYAAPGAHPAPTAQPADLHALAQANSKLVNDYLDDYELDDGEHCPYRPNEAESNLIHDAVCGLLSDDEFVSTFNAWQDAVRARPAAPMLNGLTASETASIAGLTEPERLVKCAECDLGCRGKCRKEPPLSPSGRFPGGLVGEPAVRVARITLDGVTLTVPADQLTALGLGEDAAANTYTLTFATMTRADFEALGEFDGF